MIVSPTTSENNFFEPVLPTLFKTVLPAASAAPVPPSAKNMAV